MGKLNLRLACSCLAAAIIIVLALLPATRAIVQRHVWIATGAYDLRTGRSGEEYVDTNHDQTDARIALLLAGYNRIPVEGRAFELAKFAADKKTPAMWAHVIRQTSMVGIQLDDSIKFNAGDKIRRESLANLEITAAREGQKMAPDNAFFYLAEATGLARQGRWDDTLPVLERGARTTRFDDYTLDEVKRRARRLRSMVREPLPSEIGYEWAAIVLPHFSSYNQLTRGFSLISDPKHGLRAGLAASKIGLLLEKTDMYKIGQLVGVGMVKRSVVRLSSNAAPTDEFKADFKPALEMVIAKSHSLGLTEIEEGWKQFRHWTPSQPNLNPTDVPEEVPVKGAQALLTLTLIGLLGFGLWLCSQIDPSSRNIWTVAVGMGALTTPLAYVGGGWMAISYAYASLLLFIGFLLLRLPGKQAQGYWVAIAGAVVALLPSLQASHVDIFLRVLGFWTLPFLFSHFVKWSAPRWLGVGISTILLGISIALLANGMSADVSRIQRDLPDLLTTVLALAIISIPWLTATTMSLTKVNLPEGLKTLATPLPLFALMAAGVFAYTVREDYRMEQLWKSLSQSELSPTLKKALAEEGL